MTDARLPHLTRLPDDPWQQIAPYLTLSDVGSVSSANKTLHVGASKFKDVSLQSQSLPCSTLSDRLAKIKLTKPLHHALLLDEYYKNIYIFIHIGLSPLKIYSCPQ
jgi:hypothetical protein